MKAYIILGNTRVVSNTEALSNVFADALTAKGIDVVKVSLREKNIQSCVGCDKCHKVSDSFGCVIQDDMQEIANEILTSDLVVLTSPIYTLNLTHKKYHRIKNPTASLAKTTKLV